MATDTSKTTKCKYCREEVMADAVKCKHCGSRLASDKPSHGGTCPYCKEQINQEAIKCRHCKSSLIAEGQGGFGCGCSGGADPVMATARLGTSPGAGPFGGGGVFVDPGHACWGDCVDAYVSCRFGGGDADTCRRAFASCKRGCPA